MRIHLLFFSILREIAGLGERGLDVPAGTRTNAVWEQLRAEYPRLTTYRIAPLAAINEEYVAPDSELHEGDELAFIPPVAGG